MEPGTAIGTGLALFGAKDLIGKILGPSADYLGNETAGLTKKGVENVKRIFSYTTKLLGEKINDPGGVNPKVLKLILNEGYFCEDEVSSQYFAGVLAASRSEDLKDDRGSYYLGILSRLTSYQIKGHYVLYTWRRMTTGLFKPRSLKIDGPTDKDNVNEIPMKSFAKSMNFSKDNDFEIITPHIINGLRGEGLISRGSVTRFRSVDRNYCILFETSSLGDELYYWAHGLGNVPVETFLTESKFPKIDGIDIAPPIY